MLNRAYALVVSATQSNLNLVTARPAPTLQSLFGRTQKGSLWQGQATGMVTLKDSSCGAYGRTADNRHPGITTDEILGRVVTVVDEPLKPSQEPGKTFKKVQSQQRKLKVHKRI